MRANVRGCFCSRRKLISRKRGARRAAGSRTSASERDGSHEKPTLTRRALSLTRDAAAFADACGLPTGSRRYFFFAFVFGFDLDFALPFFAATGFTTCPSTAANDRRCASHASVRDLMKAL